MEPLLRLVELKKYFPVKDGARVSAWVKAVDGVSLSIGQKVTLGVVGESGCGKTTLANLIVGLEQPTAGQVYFEGQDMQKLNPVELKKARSNIQIVFQDPFWSLNPRWLVRDVVGEPLKVHLRLKQGEYVERVEQLLGTVGLPKDAAYKYPHEFSGGQRQRIAIARALASKPKFILLDEPVSAIDIVSQVQILDMLQGLKDEMGLSYILISHDLEVVNSLSDFIVVMYLGKVVEYGSARSVFGAPAHPYTRALLDSIPKQEVGGIDAVKTLEGEIPSAINPPSGCRFHTRCKYAMARCATEEPTIFKLDNQHEAWCWLLESRD